MPNKYIKHNEVQSIFHLALAVVGVQRRSADHAELLAPCSQTTLRQRCCFSVTGPATCNWLPISLYLVPRGHMTPFFTNVKTVLFSLGWTRSVPG